MVDPLFKIKIRQCWEGQSFERNRPLTLREAIYMVLGLLSTAILIGDSGDFPLLSRGVLLYNSFILHVTPGCS